METREFSALNVQHTPGEWDIIVGRAVKDPEVDRAYLCELLLKLTVDIHAYDNRARGDPARVLLQELRFQYDNLKRKYEEATIALDKRGGY